MDPGDPAPTTSLRRSLLPWAVLALLVGVAAVTWLSSGSKGGSAGTRLADAARDLARLDAEAWLGLEPLPPADLAAARPPSDGALRVVAPQGLVLDVRPRVRWSGGSIDARFEVRMLPANPEAEPLWISGGSGRFADFPPEARALVPGTYGVEVAPAPGAPAARTTFEVAGDAARQRLARVLGAVERSAPSDLRHLLAGHACVRLGFLLEAERHAQAALSADPRSEAALALLRYVHAQLGEGEGWGR